MAALFKVILFITVIPESFASTVQFLAIPTSVKVPETAVLEASDLSLINEFILGLSSYSPVSWNGKGDILNRPKALAVVTVSGLKPPESHQMFSLGSGDMNMDSVNIKLNETFGKDHEWIDVSSVGISGSNIAMIAQNANLETSVKTKRIPLRKELENVYKLAESLKATGSRVSISSPHIYQIQITGLSSASDVPAADYDSSVTEINKAVNFLVKVLGSVYDDQVVVELVDESETVGDHRIRRRNAALPFPERLQIIREQLNVYVFTSSDYPAIFAIFAGLIIILSIALLFIIVGMLNMDPGKDSIIYRMTTTRMKKD